MHTLKNIKRNLVKSFAKKRILAILETEIVPCPVCGKNDGFQTLYTVDRYRIPVSVVKCECGMAFENPMPTDSFLSRYYGSYLFRALDWGVFRVTAHVVREFKAEERAEHRIQLFYAYLSKFVLDQKRSILDIGASEGTFLKLLHNHFPLLKRFAVEPGKNFSHLIDLGVERVWNDVSDIPKEIKFDFVTLSHVLEHVKNPKQFIVRIKELCLPGAYFIVEVPDIDRYGDSIRPIHIDHTLHFSKATLSRILTEAGFEIVHVVSIDKYLMDSTYGIAIIARNTL